MAAVESHTKWVSLAFLRGALLPDPVGLLEGRGRRVPRVKVKLREQVEEQREVLRGLIPAATSTTP